MTICHIPPSDSRVMLKMLCEGALKNIETGKKEHNEIYFTQLIRMFDWMEYGGYPKEKGTVGTEDVNRIVLDAIFTCDIPAFKCDTTPCDIRDLLVILNTNEPKLSKHDEILKNKLTKFLQRVIEDLDRVIKGEIA